MPNPFDLGFVGLDPNSLGLFMEFGLNYLNFGFIGFGRDLGLLLWALGPREIGMYSKKWKPKLKNGKINK